MKRLRNDRKRIGVCYAVGALSLFAAAVLGLLFGSTRISFSDILSLLSSDPSSAGARILLYVRLPRTLGALICGAALAVCGAVIQGVLANRLASPSILGVNAGAGLAVTVCSALGVWGGVRVSFFAFLGAALAVFLISLGAKKWGASRGTVILMGVALNSLLGAVSDTITTFLPEALVMSSHFKIGDFSAVTYEKLLPAAILILCALAALFTLSRELDVLTLGDDGARGLGVNVEFMRVVFLLLSALLAGAAVSVAGLLSFVGLLVPHAVRRVSSSEAKHLLPLCALFGAAFVTLCDTLSRTLLAPHEIPVGIPMALLGAPFFVFILIGKRGRREND